MRGTSKTFQEARRKAMRNLEKQKSKVYFDTTTWQLVEKQRKRPEHTEEKIQEDCVEWMNDNFPEFVESKLFYHVPNGGKRDAVTAYKMKKAGVVAGVADLALDVASKGYHGLKIEMKTPKGRQSPHQKIYQRAVEEQGYKYIICRSVDEFAKEITEYLKAEI